MDGIQVTALILHKCARTIKILMQTLFNHDCLDVGFLMARVIQMSRTDQHQQKIFISPSRSAHPAQPRAKRCNRTPRQWQPNWHQILAGRCSMNHLFGSFIRLLYKLARLLVTPEMLPLFILLGIAGMILLSDLPLFLRLY